LDTLGFGEATTGMFGAHACGTSFRSCLSETGKAEKPQKFLDYYGKLGKKAEKTQIIVKNGCH